MSTGDAGIMECFPCQQCMELRWRCVWVVLLALIKIQQVYSPIEVQQLFSPISELFDRKKASRLETECRPAFNLLRN